MKLLGRSGGHSSNPAGPGEIASSPDRVRGGRRRRVLSAVLFLGVAAALVRPAQRGLRSVVRRLDAHAEGLTEPGSNTYVHFFAPLLDRMYAGVAQDVGRELSARGQTRRPTIVDVGCGPGDLVVAISRRLHDARIVGVDLSPSMLLWAGRHATTDGRLRFIVGDAANLPIDDATVDLVVSTLSLHHWAEPSEAFAEIARVLRPGGAALIYDLGLISYTSGEISRIAVAAGLEPDDVARKRARGWLLSRFFVRVSFDGPA